MLVLQPFGCSSFARPIPPPHSITGTKSRCTLRLQAYSQDRRNLSAAAWLWRHPRFFWVHRRPSERRLGKAGWRQVVTTWLGFGGINRFARNIVQVVLPSPWRECESGTWGRETVPTVHRAHPFVTSIVFQTILVHLQSE